MSKDQSMFGMSPQVLKQLLDQQMSNLQNGQGALPKSWGFGKPLTEDEFKKMRAEKGASIVKTIGDSLTESNDSKTTPYGPKIEGTIEEILKKINAEKASDQSTQPINRGTKEDSPETHEDLRQKLRSRLQAKVSNRMSKYAVSTMVTKKMSGVQPTQNNDTISSQKNTDI